MVLYLRIFFALMYAAALVAYPGYALAGARDGLRLWAVSVAPAILPFAAVVPYLTCEEVRRIYDRLLGGAMRRLFRLPGGAASAMVTGMIAGSPAGALAAARVAASEGMTRGEALRLAGMCCGVSPVYALSVMGIGLNGSAAMGWRLVISQAAAQLITGLLFRGAFNNMNEGVEAGAGNEYESPVSGAVNAVLRAGGYMAVFSAGLSMAYGAAGGFVRYISPLMDLPSGSVWLAGIKAPGWTSAMALGFGGACIASQNLAVLKGTGINGLLFLGMKLICGMVCGAVYAVIGKACGAETVSAVVKSGGVFDMSMLVMAFFILPAVLFSAGNTLKNIFLNNRKLGE